MQGKRRPLPPAKPLTPKQERFCEEYIVDLNIAAAGKRAGFSPSAHIYELMQDDRILKRIEELQKKVSIRTAVTTDDIISEYKKIAKSNIADYMEVKKMNVVVGKDSNGNLITQMISCLVLKDTDEIDPETLGAIKGVKKFKDGSMVYELWDKTAALTKLGEHLGMFKPETNINLTQNVVTVQLPKELEDNQTAGDNDMIEDADYTEDYEDNNEGDEE